ncbi:MAG TPA: nucleotidyl transferase AbiEii/AbiGii toxin family protein [Thermoanaerobaculia bacterium]
MDFDEAKRILRALEQERVRYVLVGSMAMAAQGLVRATRDMDFFVAPDAENVERLRRALRSVFGADPSLEQITAEDLGGDYPAIEYVPPEGAYSLDILSRLGEAFRYEQIEAEDLVVDGIRVRVATPRMLYRMKRDTVRPLDRIDAEAIRERFRLAEEE